MDSPIDHDFLPFLKVYKDGHVERLIGTGFVPASINSHPTVSSKDVILNTETGLSARLYIPKNINNDKKLPLLIYFHGGAFMVESAFSPLNHNYLNSVVEEASVVVVSVNYRLAPENHLPIAYDDSWEAIQWVASHAKGEEGQEAWLKIHADFDKVFLGGDSAGANIVHNMAMLAGEVKLKNDVIISGVVLVHPYFWGKERIGSERSDPVRSEMNDRVWVYVCPTTSGHDDPRLNPVAVGAPSLGKLGCGRVLVFVAGKDVFRDGGLLYYNTVKKSGWGGVAEVIETEGEDHIFHHFSPTSDKAISMLKSLASFINNM